MRKKCKGYLVFTSLLYRIVMFALMPVALVAAGIWGGVRIGDIGLMFVVMVLPAIEIFSDSWLFGGIQGKDMEKMDYLKTSGRGMAVMRGALIVDLLRKLLTAVCIIAICYLVIGLSKDTAAGMAETGRIDLTDFLGYGDLSREVGFLLYLILLSYTVSVLGTFLSRYGSSIYMNMLVAYGAAVLMVFGVFGLGLRGYLWQGFLVLDVLFAALGTGISILAVKVAMKKVEGGYHDE